MPLLAGHDQDLVRDADVELLLLCAVRVEVCQRAPGRTTPFQLKLDFLCFKTPKMLDTSELDIQL